MSRSDIMRNLSEALAQIENATGEGLEEAGLFVQAESQEIVPQDQGFLINTAFTRKTAPDRVVIGYTADYAAFVHEMPETFNYSKPGTGPKYLEKAAKNNVRQIVDIVRRRAAV